MGTSTHNSVANRDDSTFLLRISLVEASTVRMQAVNNDLQIIHCSGTASVKLIMLIASAATAATNIKPETVQHTVIDATPVVSTVISHDVAEAFNLILRTDGVCLRKILAGASNFSHYQQNITTTTFLRTLMAIEPKFWSIPAQAMPVFLISFSSACLILII